MPVRLTLATANAPGAIAIVQLHGAGAVDIAEQLCGFRPARRGRLASFADIDEGLAVALRDDFVQLMPHGGLRVVQRLIAYLVERGALTADAISPRDLFPEATSDLQADMLAILAVAASPAAIDLLLDQPRRWREALACDAIDFSKIAVQTRRLDRLVTPPAVVLVGRVNVGKSTLSNRIMGRSVSITADLPGTTREGGGGVGELPMALGEWAVRWFDTPGLRESDDPIERRAIALSRRVIQTADVLIAMRDPRYDWPDLRALTRQPDLWVMNKADLGECTMADGAGDLGEPHETAMLKISALRNEGVDALFHAIAEQLGLTHIDAAIPWAFSATLTQLIADGDLTQLRRYAGL